MEYSSVAIGERARRVRSSRDGVAPVWQEATVTAVIDETPDAVTLRLRLDAATDFLPGQYYNVRLAVPGRPRPVQRAYSVGSSPLPDPSVVDLGIREVPGGLLSPLLTGLRVGERLSVRGPYGRFTWDGRNDGPVLLVGAGSGIVLLMSMVRHAAPRGRGDPVVLICSAITYSHAFYRDELAGLASSHSWLRVVHCTTRDLDEPRAHYHRRVDKAVLSESLGGNHPGAAYLCGPPAMVESVAAHLVDLGVRSEAIWTEKYD
jgi:ferredoxin-NADP reductase